MLLVPATSHLRLSAALAVVTVAASTLAGCSGRTVSAATPTGAGNPLCATVASAWPSTVAGKNRLTTDNDSPAVAAWGDDASNAIIARCGLSSPGPTSEDCISADGIDWIARRLENGTAFTTYGRSPAVEVLVPSSYSPTPLVLGAFSGAAGKIPQGAHHCS